MSHPLQVSTNGFISLAEPSDESEYLGKMPVSFGMIAAFLGDLDTTDGAGHVYFRQDKSPDVLQRAAEHISQAFPSNDRIEPTHAIIVTWENVAPQSERGRGDDYTVCPSILNILHLQKLVIKQAQQHLQVKSPLFKFLLQYARICKVMSFNMQ